MMVPVLIVAIVFGSIIILNWMKMIAQEREADRRVEGGAAIGVRDLEERIAGAVAAAIAPLRDQITEMEERLESRESLHQLEERGEGRRLKPPPEPKELV